MKPILMRAVACECLLLAPVLLAAGAQKAAPDLTTLQIDDLLTYLCHSRFRADEDISAKGVSP